MWAWAKAFEHYDLKVLEDWKRKAGEAYKCRTPFRIIFDPYNIIGV